MFLNLFPARELGVAIQAAPPKTGTGRVRLHTLVLIRWIAVFGQTSAVLSVYFLFGYDFPLVATLVVIGASVLLNVVVTLHYPISRWLDETEAVLYLVYDTLQIAALLYLTGGLHNPFSFLMLGTVTISATVLSARVTVLLGLLIITCATLLSVIHLPLPWPKGPYSPSHVYVFGIWASIVICIAFFSVNVLRLAEEGRRMADALTETQMILAREQRLSAVGSLAAAAAHELGTPLGTIALVAKELSRDLPADSPYTDDVELLISQSKRCRDVLARLTIQPSDGTSSYPSRLPMLTLVEMAATPHRRDGIEPKIAHDPGLTGKDRQLSTGSGGKNVEQPIIFQSLEILHGLENLIENATDFADEEVLIKVDWSNTEVAIEILDDGPGFKPDILDALGDPYISTRRDAGGMGLGVFIAKTLLERTSATITFSNRRERGARVAIVWPRDALEATPARTEGEASSTADARDT